jgi:hypothetical protein
MRTALCLLLIILLGIAAGVGTAVLRIKHTPWHPERDESVAVNRVDTPPPGEPKAKVSVDQIEFNFGTLDMESSGSHDFVFTNAGNAPLKLTAGKTSCRCTTSKLDPAPVPPGGSTKVTVLWKHAEKLGPYTQTAYILTNDPLRPQVVLAITGQITARARFWPPALVFSRLSAGERATAETRLYCYLEKPLKLIGHAWSNAAAAKFFDATWQPLSAAEVQAEPLARSGWLVKVTVNPGLPQGPVDQQLVLKTDLPSLPAVGLPIQGVIGSEIAIAGPGWDADTGVLNLGEVSRQAGAQRRLMLVVRGPLHKQITFKPASIVPSVLKATLGQRSEINNGAITQIPLLIEIPKGSPPGNHLGSDQGQLGEILLETTHPRVPKLRILVRFAIEG